jgi:hypothetical protein
VLRRPGDELGLLADFGAGRDADAEEPPAAAESPDAPELAAEARAALPAAALPAGAVPTAGEPPDELHAASPTANVNAAAAASALAPSEPASAPVTVGRTDGCCMSGSVGTGVTGVWQVIT